MATDEKFVSKFSDRRELGEPDGFRSPQSGVAAGEEKRRGIRLNSQVPVILQWESGGVKREVHGRTRVVNPYGCLILLPEKVALDGELQLTNEVRERKARRQLCGAAIGGPRAGSTGFD